MILSLSGAGLACLVVAITATACEQDADRVRSTIEREHGVVSAAGDVVGPADTSVDAASDAVADTVEAHDSAAQSDTAVEPDAVVVTDSIVVSDAADVAESDTADTSVESDTTSPIICHIGDISGECRPVGTCASGEAGIEQVCAGSPQVRCCLPALDRCSADGVPGACIDTGDCPAGAWTITSGRCPGPAAIKCCSETARENTCDESAKPTPNDGFTTEAPGDPGCPAGMAAVAGFCIDRYEASLVLAADPSQSVTPFFNPGALAVRAVSVEYAVPQGYIDEVRAAVACQAAGKRLCTTTEWLRACRGPDDTLYPYGPDRQPGVCNDDRPQHVAIEYFGTTDSWIYSEIDNPCLTQLPASIDLSGENPGCVSADGVFDLMGNLHEWVDDPDGTFRGGFFDDTHLNGDGCAYRTIAHDVHHWDYSTGFRCCADAQ